jgi:hypothetical protein
MSAARGDDLYMARIDKLSEMADIVPHLGPLAGVDRSSEFRIAHLEVSWAPLDFFWSGTEPKGDPVWKRVKASEGPVFGSEVRRMTVPILMYGDAVLTAWSSMPAPVNDALPWNASPGGVVARTAVPEFGAVEIEAPDLASSGYHIASAKERSQAARKLRSLRRELRVHAQERSAELSAQGETAQISSLARHLATFKLDANLGL